MKLKDIRKDAVLGMSRNFSLAATAYCKQLSDQNHVAISNELLRSATSICASIMDADPGESRADFIYRMKIAATAGVETKYWLLLCKISPGYGNPKGLLAQLDAINRMLSEIIVSA